MELPETLAGTRAIIFDVGETLVDETRMWTGWAKQAGVSSLTMFAKLGSLIERGEDHRLIWAELGVGAPDSAVSLEQSDIYPDALTCLETVKASGRFVGIAGNQPEDLEAQLRSLGVQRRFHCFLKTMGSVETLSRFLYTGCFLDRHSYKRDSLRWKSSRQRHCAGQISGHADSYRGHGAASKNDGR